MKPSPILSVIMGTYNIERLKVFNQSMESVLKQTMPDFELIICNDGSTDRTQEILEILAMQDSRVKILHNSQNEGLAAALNHCLAQAKGKYVARQDADDLSHPERFARQIEFLENHTAISFVGCNVNLYENDQVWGERIFPEFPKPKDFRFTMPFVHGTLMFRRDCLAKVNFYRVAPETRRTEDYDMLMRIYAKGMRGANLQECLYDFLEDSAAQKRRRYEYRVDEAVVRWKGFRAMGLLPGALPYVVKPLIVGLLPRQLLTRLKKTRKY